MLGGVQFSFVAFLEGVNQPGFFIEKKYSFLLMMRNAFSSSDGIGLSRLGGLSSTKWVMAHCVVSVF